MAEGTRLASPGWRLGPPKITLRGEPVFYGWWIVVASVVMTLIGGGFYIHGFSAFMLPLGNEFDVGRAQVALVFSAAHGTELLLGPAVGFAVDRFGSRRMMLVGIPIFAGGFFLLSFASSLLMVFVAIVFVVSPGTNIGVFAPMATAVSQWFRRRRAIALAVGTTGFGIGGLVVPFVQFFIDEWDWRIAARAVAVTILVVGLPVAIVLVRNRPEDLGLEPDGDPPAASGDGGKPRTAEIDFTPREAVASPAFWGVAFWFGLRMYVVASVSLHFVPLVGDLGFSAATAAGLLGVFAVATIPCRLALGVIADRVRKNILAGVLGCVQLFAIVILLVAQEYWHLLAFVLVYAISWGGAGANMLTAIRADYFGRRHFATIGGLISAVMIVGAVVGPFSTGLIFDETGSYDLAILVFLVMTTISTVIIFLTGQPAPKSAHNG